MLSIVLDVVISVVYSKLIVIWLFVKCYGTSWNCSGVYKAQDNRNGKIAVKYNELIPMNLQSVNSTMLGELQWQSLHPWCYSQMKQYHIISSFCMKTLRPTPLMVSPFINSLIIQSSTVDWEAASVLVVLTWEGTMNNSCHSHQPLTVSIIWVWYFIGSRNANQ